MQDLSPQDERALRKVRQGRAQALEVQSEFRVGTSEHCLAGALIQAVNIVTQKMNRSATVSHATDTSAQIVEKRRMSQ